MSTGWDFTKGKKGQLADPLTSGSFGFRGDQPHWPSFVSHHHAVLQLTALLETPRFPNAEDRHAMPTITESWPTAILEKPVSDRGTLGGLTQFAVSSVQLRPQVVDSKYGEMAEWLKAHAWKLIPSARADAHRIPPTHFRSTTSCNNDLLQRVLVNDGVAPGFRGVCYTVLTQDQFSFTQRETDLSRVRVPLVG